MATELIITSVPKGLKPGSYGFCTAACTKDLNEPTSRALEVISGYRHLFSPEEGKANPVAFSYLLYEFAGRQRRVLSRVADMGLDYSGRTNKIAHHLVLSEEEAKRPAGPAALCASGVFMERWPEDEQPHYLDARTVSCSESINVNAIKTGAWQKLTGDSGWAGVLAGTVLTRRPVILIVRPDQDVLTLFREALVLLKPEERWKATFSTYYTSLPANAQCQWRALVDGAYDEKLLRIPNAITLDLRNPSALPRVDEIALTPQEKTLVDLARGAASASAEAPQSWEPLGLTPEEAPKSRAPGRGPNPRDRKDDVFFGSVDNGDNSTLGEGYKPDGSTGVSYMPPSHKKSGMIWVLIGFLAGLVILAIVSLALWLMLESKNGEEPKSDEHAAAQTPEVSSNAGKPGKEKIEEKPGGEEDGISPSPKGSAESDEETNPPTDEKAADGKTEQTPNNEDESQPAEEENLSEEEPEQHSANPDVLKLEEQWNKLKEEKNFDKTVLFVEGQRSDIDSLYKELSGNIDTCDMFFKKYDEHKPKAEQKSEGEQKSDELETVTNLCDQIADAQTAAENLANKFDIELFQKKCEVAVQGMDQIIALYNVALSDKDLVHRSSTLKGLNDALIKAHFAEAKSKSSDDKSDKDKKDEKIEDLSDKFTPIRDKFDDIYRQSIDKGRLDKLAGIKSRVSEFPEMRKMLEQEILAFIVQTINSNDGFAAFTENLKGSKKVPVKFGDTKQELFVWDHIGEDKTSKVGEGLEAYVKHCARSQNQWVCDLTFAFNKTDKIDAQDKTVGFIPGSKDGEVFNVNVKGKPVSLGVKMSLKDGRLGCFDFYTSDPESIPAILRSARVCISFKSKVDPELTGFKSEFCQLLKPIDMSKTADIEADKFLMSCEYITEADFEKIDRDSQGDNAVCVIVCDKEGKVKDKAKTDLYSLKLDLNSTPESNNLESETSQANASERESYKEAETAIGKRILLQFSRTTEHLKGYEGSTVVYKWVYAHSLFNTVKKFSSSYEEGWIWSPEDEKATLSDSSSESPPAVFVDDTFKSETFEQWQTGFGTGKLLFYLVRVGDKTPRENWILYGKAPYRVVFPSQNDAPLQTSNQTDNE